VKVLITMRDGEVSQAKAGKDADELKGHVSRLEGHGHRWMSFGDEESAHSMHDAELSFIVRELL
jgi:hypothetical protein